MNKIVVFSGKMKSGKDESARILQEYDPSFQRMALADKVKEIYGEISGLPLPYIEEHKSEHRSNLILVGQTGRKLNENIWLDKLDLNKLMTQNSVITDVRFKNELQRFQQFRKWKDQIHVIIVRVKASDEIRIERGAQPELFNNISEVDLDEIGDHEFDYLIFNNNNDLNQLKVQVEYLYKNLIKNDV